MTLQQIIKNNNGIAKMQQFLFFGFKERDVYRAVNLGEIVSIRKGYYVSNETAHDEPKLMSILFPDGVLCMHTALFYYGYSNRTPSEWDIAIHKDVSKSRFNISYPFIKPYYSAKSFDYGITEANYNGIKLKIFDRDRLICQVLEFENKMDKEIFNKAIQAYIADSQKKVQNLLSYAKKLNFLKKVKTWIGVWL